MAISRKLFAAAGLLAGLALAGDPSLTELIMPDARMVAGIKLQKILASPIGRILKSQFRAQMEKNKPQWPAQMAFLAGFDWSDYLREILIATPGGPSKNPAFLVLVRFSAEPAQLDVLKALAGSPTEYMGVPLLPSKGKSNIVIALLENSTAVFGRPADVKAAIRRQAQHAAAPAALAGKVRQFNGRYDAWLFATGPLPVPPQAAPAGVKTGFLQTLDGLQGGVRFSPDFELSAELANRTEKDAAGMLQGLGWLLSAMQAQANGSGPHETAGLENMKIERAGKRVLISLRVPEEQVRLALQRHARAAQAASAKTSGSQAPPSRGPAPPPPGTIRIESSPSDMGTVLLPAGKPEQ